MKRSALLIFTKCVQLGTFPVIASDRDSTNAVISSEDGYASENSRTKILPCGDADTDVRHVREEFESWCLERCGSKKRDISKCVLYFTLT